MLALRTWDDGGPLNVLPVLEFDVLQRFKKGRQLRVVVRCLREVLESSTRLRLLSVALDVLSICFACKSRVGKFDQPSGCGFSDTSSRCVLGLGEIVFVSVLDLRDASNPA